MTAFSVRKPVFFFRMPLVYHNKNGDINIGDFLDISMSKFQTIYHNLEYIML